MSQIIRSQLVAARASATALIAVLDAAIMEYDRARSPETGGLCSHPETERERVQGMGGATPVELCLRCGKEVKNAAVQG